MFHFDNPLFIDVLGMVTWAWVGVTRLVWSMDELRREFGLIQLMDVDPSIHERILFRFPNPNMWLGSGVVNSFSVCTLGFVLT